MIGVKKEVGRRGERSERRKEWKWGRGERSKRKGWGGVRKRGRSGERVQEEEEKGVEGGVRLEITVTLVL